MLLAVDELGEEVKEEEGGDAARGDWRAKSVSRTFVEEYATPIARDHSTGYPAKIKL